VTATLDSISLADVLREAEDDRVARSSGSQPISLIPRPIRTASPSPHGM